jgi:hypothetical protein
MNRYLHNNPPHRADLIFVLAGRENRKQFALKLFDQGLAPKILFSVARFEIRRFSKLSLPVPLDLLKMASSFPSPQRHFFVFFEGQRVEVEHVRPRRFGTLTEIESLGHWLQGHAEIRSLLIISSDTHLRRIRLCCDSFLDPSLEVALIAAPDTSVERRESVPKIAALAEMLKTISYWVILVLRRDWLRSNHKDGRTGTQD